MVVRVREPPPAAAAEIDAGVIRDARRRQRRHRAAAAVLLAAVAAGLILGFGGRGDGTARRATDHGRARAGGQPPPGRSTDVAVRTAPAGISQIGLLAPDVGWAASPDGLYVTGNGGRGWTQVHVPGLGTDATAGIAEAASPAGNHAALVLNAILAYGSCAIQGYPDERAPINAIATTADGGRTWRTYTLDSCVDPYSLSFVNAGTAFMAAWESESGRAPYLYATTDGGRHWQRIARLPFPGSITFATAELGLGMGFWSDATTGVAGTPRHVTLYRTTDGGHSWRRFRARCTRCGRQNPSPGRKTPPASGAASPAAGASDSWRSQRQLAEPATPQPHRDGRPARAGRQPSSRLINRGGAADSESSSTANPGR